MRTFFAFAAAAALSAIATASDVVDATDATFDDVVKSGMTLMEFYAPWCGHCKKLTPEWETAATELKGLVTVAKVDATEEKAVASKYEIQGFPTIKIFQDGEMTGEYEGGRTAKDIIAYAKSMSGPAVRDLEPSAVEAARAEAKVLVVFYGATLPEAFSAFAKKKRAEMTFGFVQQEAAGIAPNTVVLYRAADGAEEKMDGSAEDAESLAEFVEASSLPVFDEMGPENYKKYMGRGLPIAWLFTPTTGEEAKTACMEVAKEFKSKLSFVWVDSDKYGSMAQRLGLTDKFPGFVIDKEGKHFAMPADAAITTEAVKEFTEKYVAGTLEATVRSEEEPAEHTVEGLTTVVGKTFDDLVGNADVDVLVEFYAPWCGHCKQLAPVFKKVSKDFEAEPVRVAMIDATANDHDQSKFPVQGFPTLFWVPKDTHTPVPYEGGRTEEDLTKFLKEKLGQ